MNYYEAASYSGINKDFFKLSIDRMVKHIADQIRKVNFNYNWFRDPISVK